MERNGGKSQGVSNEHPKTKKDQNDKISSPFQTLVKMSSGKNPSTFSLPPELTCHTYFPGKYFQIYLLSFEIDALLDVD